MHSYVSDLLKAFEAHANPEVALGQRRYMKNHFEFFGLKSSVRREIQKPFLSKDRLPPKHNLDAIIHELWSLPQREFQYFAQELCVKYLKQLHETDLTLYEYMISFNSWWDTVDFISVNLVGAYFKKYPINRDRSLNNWIESSNIWLQRAAILFQLKYKEHLDRDYLSCVIQKLLGSNEFFINKAIGWILREYSKSNPDWVIEFVERTSLSKLSQREALRLIGR